MIEHGRHPRGEDEELDEIERRMSRKEKVGANDRIRVYRRREARLSQELESVITGKKRGNIGRLHKRLMDVRRTIFEATEEIGDSGGRGGDTMGGSRRLSRNNPRK